MSLLLIRFFVAISMWRQGWVDGVWCEKKSMIGYPEIDPVALSIGPLKVHWYGIMYLISFIAVWRLFLVRSRQPWSSVKSDQVEDIIFYGAMGVILGGRFGYVFFYQFQRFLEEPLWLIKLWDGGMSFHGGLLGVLFALFLLSRKFGIRFIQLGDFVAPMVPVGLFFGRMGNFIGQELWGRPTEGWWAMVFPNDPEQLARHPSQLYQAFLEGLLLFTVLWLLSKKPRPTGFLSGAFLAGYGIFRMIAEFAREPDAHLADSLIFGWVTRGQLLSLPMLFAGLGLIVWAVMQNNKKTT